VRVLVCDTIYERFAKTLYSEQPELAKQSYEAQKRAIWDTAFGTADAYVRSFRKAGHEAEGLVSNWPPLQSAWIKERRFGALWRGLWSAAGNVAATQTAIEQLVLLAQAATYAPDVVFIQDPWRVTDRTLRLLRRRHRLIVGQLASSAPPLERLAHYDLLLSSFPHFVERFREAGIDSEYLPLAYDTGVEALLARRSVSPDAYAGGRTGAVLIGGLTPATYSKVTPALEQLGREVGLEVWGYGAADLPAGSALLADFRGELWGLDMYARMARALVVVNRHNDAAEGYANNMRLFEATAMGAAVVTETAPNLPDLFEPGEEVATYEDGDSLVAVVEGLLNDPERAARLGAAGRARTLRDHTYDHRVSTLISMFEGRLARARHS
jgi:spore maturation protein CgeB